MLYKVTPAMPSAGEARKEREPGSGRGRRKSAVYDADGHEVLITLMCLKCHKMRPLSQFGLRRMSDGSIRNQPWCRGCRSGAGAERPRRPAETDSPVDVGAAAPPSDPVSPAPRRPVDAGQVAAQVAAALAGGWGK